MIDERLLKSEERAAFSLRSLYRKYGYLPFKMSKFEEYEIYIRNKDFLVSDRIITFNDTNGRLMALKPDVTLSIIKNGEDIPGCKQKVYYSENVYRVSDSTHNYKEIMQAGLECIGDVDLYDIYEVTSLAAQSLAVISDAFVLEVSHLGILSAVLDEISSDEIFRKSVIGFIAEKNAHDLERLCSEYGATADAAEKLSAFITVYGNRAQVLSRLRPVCSSPSAAAALEEFSRLSAMLENSPFSDKIIYDFSVVNDMNYYSGLVFKGFVDGICDGVLSGGQYDKLMEKMGRSSGAVGFALYLDLLEQLKSPKSAHDVEVLLIYDEETDKALLTRKVEELVTQGKTVSAQRNIPPRLRYKELVRLGKEGTLC